VFETIKTLDDECAEIYRGHAFYDAPDLRKVLRRWLENRL